MSAENGKKKRLGEILIEEGLINDLQLSRALGAQKQWGGKIGETLLRHGMISEDDLAYALQSSLKVKWLALKGLKISEEAVRLLPAATAKELMVIPVGMKKTTVYVATTDPSDIRVLDTVAFNLGKKVQPIIATQTDIKWAIARYYDKTMPEEEAATTPVKVQVDLTEAQDKSSLFLGTQDRSAEGPGLQARSAGPGRPQDRQNIESTLNGLISLMLEKKMITREELTDKIAEGDI
jgi:hypothetical protein